MVWGNGKEKRDLLYIDDLVHFVKLSIQNQKKNLGFIIVVMENPFP